LSNSIIINQNPTPHGNSSGNGGSSTGTHAGTTVNVFSGASGLRNNAESFRVTTAGITLDRTPKDGWNKGIGSIQRSHLPASNTLQSMLQ
jgi:hypothetical protein